MNRVTLIGRLGRDIELRYTKSNNAVVNVSLATDDRVKRGDEWEKETEWHNLVIWGKTAENCEKYLRKGSQVAVEGSLKTREWTDKDGNKKRTTEVQVIRVEFIGEKAGGSRGGGGREPGPAYEPRQIDDDEIPF